MIHFIHAKQLMSSTINIQAYIFTLMGHTSTQHKGIDVAKYAAFSN